MKLEIAPEILRDELAAVVAVVDKKPAKPMSEYVLLEPTDKHLKFTATDGTAQIEAYLHAKKFDVEDPQPVCLPARKTLDLVKLMSGGVVAIDVDGRGHATVTHGRSKYRLLSVDASRFPTADGEFGETVSLPGQILKRFIKLTRGFIGEDDSRFAFSGGLLECRSGILRMVGTDGARLTVAEYTHTDFDNENFRVLLPHKSLTALAGLIGDEDVVKIAFSRGMSGNILKAKFKVGRRFLTTNLTQGEFPAWEQIVPKTESVKCVMDRTSFANALKKSLVVSDIRNRFLEINFTDEGVVIKTDNSDTGSDVVAAEYRLGQATDDRIGINADYINQFLGLLPEVLENENNVVFSFSGQNAFIGISPENAEFDFKYLLAPVRL